ncbi:MAG: GGDEF domain-containing protein [Lachnospiraceae bacterium]|nr:GGDEF domain-containing protein [Lachnospiraceae bacterium]
MLNIALFLGELQLDSQRKVLEGITESAIAEGNNIVVYALTLSSDNEFNKGEAATMMQDDFSVYDGFIIYAESIYSEEIRKVVIDKIRKTGRPFASVDFPIEGAINISSNNEGAMRTLSRHLIEIHDIKTINFIGGPADSVDACIRRRVFEEELERVGRKLDPARCYTGDYYARSGRAAVKYYEDHGLLEADAYVCVNDQMALGAFYALFDRGISIPEDTIISGYDNIFEAANHYPRITTVNRFEKRIGKTAYRNVVLAINGKKYDKNPIINSEPVFAESCGCAARRPVNHRMVVNQYSRIKLREARYAEMISDLTVQLTNAKNVDDVVDSVIPCISELNCDAFTLAAMTDGKEDEPTQGANASVLKYDMGTISIDRDVDISEFHPRFDNTEGGSFYTIYSLHYREKYFGYTSIRNSIMPLFSEFYRVLMMTISSALEQVSNIERMQDMIKKLDEMWVYDPMTHVYNRAGFFKFSEKILEEARRDREDMFFIFLDLDGLKKVNDEYGHETGDRMICDMADVLKDTSEEEELLMRYGGDEFVVFGKGLSPEDVEAYVKRIRKAMQDTNSASERVYTLDASIGYHMVPYDNDKPLSGLIELADQDMYREKRAKHGLR